jgi:hypothetical protein
MPARRSDSAVWPGRPPSPGVAVTPAHRGRRDQLVLAVAGGIVLQPATYNYLLRNFFHTRWLKATPEEPPGVRPGHRRAPVCFTASVPDPPHGQHRYPEAGERERHPAQ